MGDLTCNGVAGRTALVTGAGSGIGEATALTFAQAGYRVVVSDLDETGAERVRDRIKARGGEATAVVADVTDGQSADAMVEAAVDAFGTVDVLVANVGGGRTAPFWEADDADWRKVIDLNLFSAWRTAKAAAPVMQRQRSGVMLFTGSTAGHANSWGLSSYVAAKHGLVGLVKAIALEMSPFGVRANVVTCGTIATPGSDGPDQRARVTGSADTPYEDYRAILSRYHALQEAIPIPTEAVAEAFLWLASDAARFTTGAAFPVDAGRLLLPGVNEKLER